MSPSATSNDGPVEGFPHNDRNGQEKPLQSQQVFGGPATVSLTDDKNGQTNQTVYSVQKIMPWGGGSKNFILESKLNQVDLGLEFVVPRVMDDLGVLHFNLNSIFFCSHMNDVLNMESLGPMFMHLNRVNIDHYSYNHSRTPINLINFSDKSIGCVVSSSHIILLRDPNN